MYACTYVCRAYVCINIYLSIYICAAPGQSLWRQLVGVELASIVGMHCQTTSLVTS